MTKETRMPFHTSSTKRRAAATASLAGLLVLVGCKQKPALDNADNQIAAPVTLPPPIGRSQTYRCKDNGLVYVDFFADDLSVNLRTSENGPISHLVAQKPGGPFSNGDYVLSGSGKRVDVTLPGKATQACES
jgi:hypothetical protein